MKTIKEKINIIPDKSLYPKLGKTGYSIAEAIAELVDNSIDARSNNRPVTTSILIDPRAKIISIEDNGMGMDKKTASNSIVLGLSDKKEKLGQFGLGLKTASMSLGKKFTIETKQKGKDEKYVIIFDEEEFLENGDWADFDIYIKKGVEKNKCGTKITIEKLRISFPANLTTYLRKQLRERFSPFILNKEAIIKVNDEILKPERVKIVPGSKRNFIINLSNGEEFKMWTGILEIGSQEKSGFNLYRRNRLIRSHEKLGYAYHPSKMWVTGEVFLDCIPVTHNKREFITTDPLYVEFLEKFEEKIKPILAEAQQRHREKRIQDLTQEIKETLKDNILKAIGRVDDFQELAFPSTTIPSKRSQNQGGLFNKEKRDSPKDIVSIEEKMGKIKIGKNKKRSPRKTQIKKVRFVTIAGKRYKFDYEWQELEEDVPKISYTDKERGFIMIILNSRFSVLNIIKDQIFYIALHVTEGIVEEFLRENSRPLDKVIELRDKTIKILADIISEDTEENIDIKTSKITEARLKLLQNQLEKQEIEGLSKRESEILRLRFGIESKPHTLQEVGEKLNLTRERIRQIEEKAISKLVDHE